MAGLEIVSRRDPALFRGIQEFSLLDYPGKVAAIVFVGGCNFRCPFCYNHALVLEPQRLPPIPGAEVLEFLRARRGWLDGVVITGGEPTIHAWLPEFVRRVKDSGYLVKLDTNGSNPGMLEGLVGEGLVDYVALDVKAPLREEKYRRATGVPGVVGRVERSIDLIRSSGVEYEFRTTVVPTLHGEEDILEIATRLRGAKRYYLQQFRREGPHLDEGLSRVEPYPREFLESLREKVSKYFPTCGVR